MGFHRARGEEKIKNVVLVIRKEGLETHYVRKREGGVSRSEKRKKASYYVTERGGGKKGIELNPAISELGGSRKKNS